MTREETEELTRGESEKRVANEFSAFFEWKMGKRLGATGAGGRDLGFIRNCFDAILCNFQRKAEKAPAFPTLPFSLYLQSEGKKVPTFYG